MKLYLVQHGEAEAVKVNPDRPLTAKGRADVEKVAVFAAPVIRDLGVIWHSGRTRARQTAEILAKHFRPCHGLVEHEGLAPGDPVDAIVPELQSSEEDIMIVGHLPFLQNLAGLLFLDNEDVETIAFRNGGIVCAEQDETFELNWRIAWIITPDILP
ncbi:MAG TPA: phosphohistidine phosphatase SixA [Planctomycetota bacterium]|nr:phosphohistidine phosphatase SixA [Planctomycetota bacterium]